MYEIMHVRGSSRDEISEAGLQLLAPSEMTGRMTSKSQDESLGQGTVDVVVDAVLVIDDAETICSVNSSVSRLLGCGAAELNGRAIQSIVHEDGRDALAGVLNRVRGGESVEHVDLSWIGESGVEIPVQCSVSPSCAKDGQVVGALIVARDARRQSHAAQESANRVGRLEALGREVLALRAESESQRQALQRADAHLTRATDDAGTAAKAKSQFLANMSHEIRTPMTAILGYISVLDERVSKADPESAEAIQVIRRNGAHLLAIIEDILDLARLDAGTLAFRNRPFSPIDVVKDVIAPMMPRARNKGIDLHLRADAGVPPIIESDSARFRQILVNLVDNAIKFTETGCVTLHVGMLATTDDSTLEVRVVDTGIGLNGLGIDALSEPFAQADSSMSRQFGGTGLGLSLCVRLAESLGGAIVAISPPSGGSEFRLTIPVRTPSTSVEDVDTGKVGATAAASQVKQDNERLDGRRVLLVEDGIDNQRLFQRFLTKAGADVSMAVNGEEAVARLQSDLESDMLPDIVIMDMQMPVMDGYEATAELRRKQLTLPIIALTAHAMTEDRARCLEAGCDDYLSKPVDRSTLIRRLCSWLNSPEQARRAVAKTTTARTVASIG